MLVAAGIFLSRISGLVRQKVLAHYLGSTDAADALNAAFRIPNLLQNLFGEGALSASFIPVYSALLAKGRREDADRVAGAIGAMLALCMSVLVAVGVAAAPWLVTVIAPGFSGAKHLLAIQLVRIIFPGIGLLVLSAWCLGILNSHRKFLLSYAAPVVWNFAQIALVIAYREAASVDAMATAAAWGSVVGAGLQVAVQLPSVLRSAPSLRLTLGWANPEVRSIVVNFGPAILGRGVMQVSAYVDAVLASLLPTGAVALFGYAQVLYTLPVSLFGMAVSAAELPAMSAAVGTDAQISLQLRAKIDGGLRRIAFFVVPSAAAFVFLGDVIAAGLFQSGRFTHDDAVKVWATLAGGSVGLLAQTWGRLYSSTFYALKDTRTPLQYAVIRVVLTTVFGWLCSIPLPHWLGVDAMWGLAGLTGSAGIAGWIEYALLKRTIDARIGETGLPWTVTARLWAAAIGGAAVAWAVRWALPPVHPIAAAVVLCGGFGVTYLALAAAFGFDEVRGIASRVTARLRRKRG